MFFNPMLMKAQADLAAAKASKDGPAFDRPALLLAAMLQLRLFFEGNAQLQLFQMTLLLKPEDTREGDERVFKYRQHLKIVAPGCDQLQTTEDKANFFYTNMPFWLMGDGSFSLERDNEQLQALLASEQGSDAERVAAYAVAVLADHAFQSVRFDHYLGETL